MRQNKIIAKPKFLKTFGILLGVFWIITAVAFVSLYFITDRKCKELIDADYSQAVEDLKTKGKTFTDLRTQYIEFNKMAQFYQDHPEINTATYYELETNKALSDLYVSLYNYDGRYDMDTGITIWRPGYDPETSSIPLYSDDIGVILAFSMGNEGKAEYDCLLRPTYPITQLPYVDEKGNDVRFSIDDLMGEDSDPDSVYRDKLRQVNSDFMIPVWFLGDKSYGSDGASGSVKIEVDEIYAFLDNGTFIPAVFEYDGKTYQLEKEECPIGLERYSRYLRKEINKCEMTIYKRPEGSSNADPMQLSDPFVTGSNVLTAYMIPEHMTMTVDLAPKGVSSFADAASDVLVINALIWFAVTGVLAAAVAYVKYLKDRSTYQIFEYRKKVTDSMAHDLKTPLAAISAYAENLEDNINTEKREYYSARIRENIELMNKTVEGILDLSKSERGERKKVRYEIDVLSLIEKEIDLTSGLFSKRGIKVEVTGEGVIRSDKELVEQAVRNLIGNTVKYARQGTTVSVSIDKGGFTISNLTDQKIDDVKSLKKVFVKGDAARGTDSGTGLGLAIADNCLSTAGHKLELEFNDETFTAKVIW